MSTLARSLAQFVFGNQGIGRRLERSAFVQGLAHRLHARDWINAALTRRPILRERAGVKYRIENFETLAVEKSYFGNPIYREILGQDPPETFIDLGCNSGIFPCLLAHLANGRAPRGLCIDANAAQVVLCEKTVKLNGWLDVHVRHGLAGGEDGASTEAEFFLHPTSLGSSQFAYRDSESGRAPDWKRVIVPTLNVENLWLELFGEQTRCNCLKVDIEGSELNFFRQETSLLSRVDSIFLEWHAWATTRDEVIHFLAAHDFDLSHTIEDTPRHGVLYFRRREGKSGVGHFPRSG